MKQADIAEKTGYSISKVKIDSHRGKFDPKDSASIERYISAAHGNTQELPGTEGDSKLAGSTPVRVVEKKESKPSEFVDKHTKSEDKGWEGSREHLLSLPVGTVYRGFSNIVVTVMEDVLGNKYMKMMPKTCGPWLKDKK